MATSQLIRVFVYGTLKRGQPNHYLLADGSNGSSQFISSAVTTQKFPLVIATRYNIPFLLNKPGIGNFINGEIYEVDEKMFEILDKLEEYPTWYDREIHEMNANGKMIPCWVYMLKNYPEKLLNLPFLASYEDSNGKPYLERSKRTVPYKTDLDEDNDLMEILKEDLMKF